MFDKLCKRCKEMEKELNCIIFTVGAFCKFTKIFRTTKSLVKLLRTCIREKTSQSNSKVYISGQKHSSTRCKSF